MKPATWIQWITIIALGGAVGCGGSAPATRLGEPGPWEVQVIAMGDTTTVPTTEAATATESDLQGGTVYRLAEGADTGEWFTETSVQGEPSGFAQAPKTPGADAGQMPEAIPGEAAEREPTLKDFTYGFRIQISATEGSMVLAEHRAAEADSLYAIPAYVEYERGWYKVRMGDFLSREEAQAFLDGSDIADRYENAFIAETYVLKP